VPGWEECEDRSNRMGGETKRSDTALNSWGSKTKLKRERLEREKKIGTGLLL